MNKLLGSIAVSIWFGLSLAVSGCDSGGSSGGVPLPPALQNMNVVSFSPPLGVTGVPTSAVIRVTFDEDVNQATLIFPNFAVSDLGGAIAGTIVYDTNTRTAVFTPAALLPVSSQIVVDLGPEILSSAGETLTPGTFVFNTGTAIDTTPPIFAGVTGTTVQSGATILVTWAAGVTDDMDASSTVSFNIYRSTTTGNQNFTAPVGVAGPNSVVFLDTGLAGTTQYFYVVRAMDTSGNEDLNTVEVNDTTNGFTSWSTQVYPLFTMASTSNCSTTGCHDSATNSGGLTLDSITTAFTELALVSSADGGCSSKRRVEPGDSGDSLLYEKLFGSPSCGSAMPLSAAPFTNPQLDLVGDWIDEGALNN